MAALPEPEFPEGIRKGFSESFAGDQVDLDVRMLAAHAMKDQLALVVLYAEAAERSEAAGDVEAACFYLTHAYVFALDEGDARAVDLHARLKARGREE